MTFREVYMMVREALGVRCAGVPTAQMVEVD